MGRIGAPAGAGVCRFVHCMPVIGESLWARRTFTTAESRAAERTHATATRPNLRP